MTISIVKGITGTSEIEATIASAASLNANLVSARNLTVAGNATVSAIRAGLIEVTSTANNVVNGLRLTAGNTVGIISGSASNYFFGASNFTVGSNNTNAVNDGSNIFPIQYVHTFSSANGFTIQQWAGAAGGPALWFGKSRSGTAGTQTVVQNNDELGSINFTGADGSVKRFAAQITSNVDGTPGSGDMPGRLTLKTTPDGAAVPVSAMTIWNDQTISMHAGQSIQVRNFTVSGNVGVTAADYMLIVNKAFTEATVVQLPQNPRFGSTYVVKDGRGNAATQNITVTVSASANTIDTTGTSVINTNFGSRVFTFNGTNFFTW